MIEPKKKENVIDNGSVDGFGKKKKKIIIKEKTKNLKEKKIEEEKKMATCLVAKDNWFQLQMKKG